MIKFEPTADAAEIKKIVTTPYIWSELSDDYDGDPADYQPKIHQQVLYVLVRDGDSIIGLLIFSMHSPICWEVTIAMLPEGKGRALETGKAGLRWIFTKSPCLRIIGRVLKSNRLALKLNKAVGFKVYGVNPKCIMRNGKLEDFVLFGISRYEFKDS